MTELYSDIPLWSLIFWAVFVVCITLFYYRKKEWLKEVSPMQRYTMIALRSMGLFLLGFLLLGILMKGKNKEIDNPSIITLVDDSKSMLNYKDSTSVKGHSIEFLKALNTSFKTDFTPYIFGLDNEIKDIDSLDFRLSKTNISQRLDKIYNTHYGRNIGAIILLSDGNFNAGYNPIMVADKFKNVPFYTLSVGDTIQKVDHLINGITANEIAFLGNQFPVEVTVEGNKTPGKSFEIKLLEDGKGVQKKQLKHQDDEYSLLKTTFVLEAKEIGIHEYTVQIDELENEFNLQNNEASFFVEVLDDRSKVLIVNEGLNPDVGAIKRVLEKENNLEVEATDLNDLPSELEDVDLVIWHGVGSSNNDEKFRQLVAAEKPTWYIITPQISNAVLAQLDLGVKFQIRQQTDDVRPAFNQEFNVFKLTAETRKTIDQFAPLKAPYGTLTMNDPSSILAYQKVGNITKKEPLFFFGKKENQKYSLTYGTGMWRWPISEFTEKQHHQSFDEIVQKTTQYLIVKENTSRLRVHLPAKIRTDEELALRAEFYNSSYEPITEPTIQLKLTHPDDSEHDFSFLPQQADYHLNLGTLSSGKYEWIATTLYNGETYSKKGSFVVRDLQLEKLDTKANHRLMRQLAANHHGKFELLPDYQRIIDDILQRDDITPVSYESNVYKKMMDYWWLLLLIVLAFTGEWFMRKFLGGY